MVELAGGGRKRRKSGCVPAATQDAIGGSGRESAGQPGSAASGSSANCPKGTFRHVAQQPQGTGQRARCLNPRNTSRLSPTDTKVGYFSHNRASRVVPTAATSRDVYDSTRSQPEAAKPASPCHGSQAQPERWISAPRRHQARQSPRPHRFSEGERGNSRARHSPTRANINSGFRSCRVAPLLGKQPAPTENERPRARESSAGFRNVNSAFSRQVSQRVRARKVRDVEGYVPVDQGRAKNGRSQLTVGTADPELGLRA